MLNILPIRSHRGFSNLPSQHNRRNSLFAAEHVGHSSPENDLGSEVNRRLLDYLHHTGFTLIELLLAIAILGILATIAVPNILREMPKFRLNGATRQIVGDLMAARMKAVSQNRRVKVFFTGESEYKICDDANNDNTVDDCEGDSRIINIKNNYKGITVDSNNNPIFSPRGTASNLATINIKNSSGTKSITIAITGRIQVS